MMLLYITRMRSSRMRTARSSSRLLGGVCLSACWDTPSPLGVGLETPPTRSLNLPLGCGPGALPGQTPQPPPGCGPGDPPNQTPQPPPWVWPWSPPRPDPSTSPWVWAWRPARHAGIPLPHVDRILDTRF